MEHELTTDRVSRPPLRRFQVQTVRVKEEGAVYEVHVVDAHLVFNNANRGEGLVFRRYYDDHVRTEKVAEFEPGTFLWYKEDNNG